MQPIRPSTTKSWRTIVLMGDSFLTEEKVRPDIDVDHPRDTIDISPHATTDADTKDLQEKSIVIAPGAHLVNYSVGGCTLDKLIKDKKRLELWARDVPELSVLHVGACEIAKRKYTKENIKKEFVTDLSTFIKQWPVNAKKAIKDNARLVARFERKLENHKWLVVKIPVWDQSEGIRYMKKKEFGELRKRANTALKNARTSLWVKQRVVVLSVDLPYPKFKPGTVHYTSPYQSAFNKQVFKAAGKVICEFCTWTKDKFVPAEHNFLVHSKYCKKDTMTPKRIFN